MFDQGLDSAAKDMDDILESAWNEHEDIHEMINHDVVTSFVACGADVENPQHCADMMKCADCEFHAFMARKDAGARGVKVAK